VDPHSDRNGGPAATPAEELPPAPPAGLPRRLREIWDERIGPTERSMLVAWGSFGATFGIARLITHHLRRGGGSGGIVIAVSGLYLAAAPFWHEAVREVARTFAPEAV
jgi:hypothetical protein